MSSPSPQAQSTPAAPPASSPPRCSDCFTRADLLRNHPEAKSRRQSTAADRACLRRVETQEQWEQHKRVREAAEDQALKQAERIIERRQREMREAVDRNMQHISTAPPAVPTQQLPAFPTPVFAPYDPTSCPYAAAASYYLSLSAAAAAAAASSQSRERWWSQQAQRANLQAASASSADDRTSSTSSTSSLQSAAATATPDPALSDRLVDDHSALSASWMSTGAWPLPRCAPAGTLVVDWSQDGRVDTYVLRHGKRSRMQSAAATAATHAKRTPAEAHAHAHAAATYSTAQPADHATAANTNAVLAMQHTQPPEQTCTLQPRLTASRPIQRIESPQPPQDQRAAQPVNSAQHSTLQQQLQPRSIPAASVATPPVLKVHAPPLHVHPLPRAPTGSAATAPQRPPAAPPANDPSSSAAATAAGASAAPSCPPAAAASAASSAAVSVLAPACPPPSPLFVSLHRVSGFREVRSATGRWRPESGSTRGDHIDQCLYNAVRRALGVHSLDPVRAAIECGLDRLAAEPNKHLSGHIRANLQTQLRDAEAAAAKEIKANKRRLRQDSKAQVCAQTLAAGLSAAHSAADLLPLYRSSPDYTAFEFGGELELQLITYGSRGRIVFTWAGAANPAWVSTLHGPRAQGAREAFLWNPGNHWDIFHLRDQPWMLHGPDAPERQAVLAAAAAIVRTKERVVISELPREFAWAQDDAHGHANAQAAVSAAIAPMQTDCAINDEDVPAAAAPSESATAAASSSSAATVSACVLSSHAQPISSPVLHSAPLVASASSIPPVSLPVSLAAADPTSPPPTLSSAAHAAPMDIDEDNSAHESHLIDLTIDAEESTIAGPDDAAAAAAAATVADLQPSAARACSLPTAASPAVRSSVPVASASDPPVPLPSLGLALRSPPIGEAESEPLPSTEAVVSVQALAAAHAQPVARSASLESSPPCSQPPLLSAAMTPPNPAETHHTARNALWRAYQLQSASQSGLITGLSTLPQPTHLAASLLPPASASHYPVGYPIPQSMIPLVRLRVEAGEPVLVVELGSWTPAQTVDTSSDASANPRLRGRGGVVARQERLLRAIADERTTTHSTDQTMQDSVDSAGSGASAGSAGSGASAASAASAASVSLHDPLTPALPPAAWPFGFDLNAPLPLSLGRREDVPGAADAAPRSAPTALHLSVRAEAPPQAQPADPLAALATSFMAPSRDLEADVKPSTAAAAVAAADHALAPAASESFAAVAFADSSPAALDSAVAPGLPPAWLVELTLLPVTPPTKREAEDADGFGDWLSSPASATSPAPHASHSTRQHSAELAEAGETAEAAAPTPPMLAIATSASVDRAAALSLSAQCDIVEAPTACVDQTESSTADDSSDSLMAVVTTAAPVTAPPAAPAAAAPESTVAASASCARSSSASASRSSSPISSSRPSQKQRMEADTTVAAAMPPAIDSADAMLGAAAADSAAPMGEHADAALLPVPSSQTEDHPRTASLPSAPSSTLLRVSADAADSPADCAAAAAAASPPSLQPASRKRDRSPSAQADELQTSDSSPSCDLNSSAQAMDDDTRVDLAAGVNECALDFALTCLGASVGLFRETVAARSFRTDSALRSDATRADAVEPAAVAAGGAGLPALAASVPPLTGDDARRASASASCSAAAALSSSSSAASPAAPVAPAAPRDPRASVAVVRVPLLRRSEAAWLQRHCDAIGPLIQSGYDAMTAAGMQWTRPPVEQWATLTTRSADHRGGGEWAALVQQRRSGAFSRSAGLPSATELNAASSSAAVAISSCHVAQPRPSVSVSAAAAADATPSAHSDRDHETSASQAKRRRQR